MASGRGKTAKMDRRTHIRRTKAIIGNSLLSLVFGCITVSPVNAQEDEIIAGGKIKYQQYCANCHGPAGKGNGEMALLFVFKPADLTQLKKNNNGEFPFWRVYRAIDGRELIRGHGTREMPLWGFVFQAEEDANSPYFSEDAVRGRIWQLVYFLESIQEKEK
jgi:mono/diheme cytochrome c family protein